MIEISGGLLLLIIGKTESIAVAPAVATDSYDPIFFAITGINKIEHNSLETFERKATPPKCVFILESSIAENEYQDDSGNDHEDQLFLFATILKKLLHFVELSSS